MVSLSRRSSRRSTVRIIPAEDLELLGLAAGARYYRHGADEFSLGPEVPGADVADYGGAFVSEPIIEQADGQSLVTGTKLRQLFEVPAGTYAAALAKAKTKRQRLGRVSPIDALAGLHLLAGRPPLVIASASAAGALSPLAPGTTATGFAPGRRPVRGREIITALERRGVTLGLVDGRLLVSAPDGKVTGEVGELVAKAERLLVGYLGSGAPCELTHKATPPEAVTVLVGGMLACADHLAGE